MNLYALTDLGMCRTENEDAYAVCPLADPHEALCVLCDGMGGESGGRQAAELCAMHIKEVFFEKKTPSKHALRAALSGANDRILRERKADDGKNARMGTTAVVALATQKKLTLLWVGDSRAYLYREGTLFLLTHDHSYVQEQIDAGKLRPEAARLHPMRNLITRAVGTSALLKADALCLPWQTGDKLLLCSDGLHGVLDDGEICEILSENAPLGMLAHGLIHTANSHGGEDNITVLLLENTKEISPNA